MQVTFDCGNRTMKQLFSQNDKNGLTLDLIEALFPMFEEASAGAIAVDRDCRITWINASYAGLLGLDEPPAVIGRYVRDVIPHTRGGGDRQAAAAGYHGAPATATGGDPPAVF